jgi:LPXTG-motif cell wall-anchored protein
MMTHQRRQYLPQNHNDVLRVVQGLRGGSGSFARTMTVGRLGNPLQEAWGNTDCSSFTLTAMSPEQTDAMTALFLSMQGVAQGQEPGIRYLTALGHVMAARAQCLYQHLNAAASTLPESPIAQAVVDAMVAGGYLSASNAATAKPYISADLTAGGVTTVERAMELVACGKAITDANGWGQYETLWASSACMTKSWYENPWYLGAGAAAIIGAVWFATRKKKAS